MRDWTDIDGACGLQIGGRYGGVKIRIARPSEQPGSTEGPCGSGSAKTGARCTNRGRVAVDVAGHRLLLCHSHAGSALTERSVLDTAISAVQRMWALPERAAVVAAMDESRPAIAEAKRQAEAKQRDAKRTRDAEQAARTARVNAELAMERRYRREEAEERKQSAGLAGTYRTPWETVALPADATPGDDGPPFWFPMAAVGDRVVWRRPRKAAEGRGRPRKAAGRRPGYDY